jgi:hypothetical protein
MPSPTLDAEKARRPNDEDLHEATFPLDRAVNREATGRSARAIDAIMGWFCLRIKSSRSPLMQGLVIIEVKS